MSTQECKQMKKLIKENGLDEDSIMVDTEFEDMCYGKGKVDDITASVYWISQNKSSQFRRKTYNLYLNH